MVTRTVSKDFVLCAGLPTPHTAPTEGLPESLCRAPLRETYGQQVRRGRETCAERVNVPW
jgi:hypothetical protein